MVVRGHKIHVAQGESDDEDNLGMSMTVDGQKINMAQGVGDEDLGLSLRIDGQKINVPQQYQAPVVRPTPVKNEDDLGTTLTVNG